MNGFFGSTPDDIVFMAIDNRYNEWDLFHYCCKTNTFTNLTPNSGYRNEDPKYSPDGKKIIYKRRYWNHSEACFYYEIAELNLQTRKTNIIVSCADLPHHHSELAMPVYTPDGKSIIYTKYTNSGSSIYSIVLRDQKSEKVIYSESGVEAYYPICRKKDLFFTKWFSTDNHHDTLIRYDGKCFYSLPVNNALYDCSDICPIEKDIFIFSSTINETYDLFIYNNGECIPLNEINTEKNELGAAFFPKCRFVRSL